MARPLWRGTGGVSYGYERTGGHAEGERKTCQPGHRSIRTATVRERLNRYRSAQFQHREVSRAWRVEPLPHGRGSDLLVNPSSRPLLPARCLRGRRSTAGWSFRHGHARSLSPPAAWNTSSASWPISSTVSRQSAVNPGSHHVQLLDALLGQPGHGVVGVRCQPRDAAQPRLERPAPLVLRQPHAFGQRGRGADAVGGIRVSPLGVLPRHPVEAEQRVVWLPPQRGQVGGYGRPDGLSGRPGGGSTAAPAARPAPPGASSRL